MPDVLPERVDLSVKPKQQTEKLPNCLFSQTTSYYIENKLVARQCTNEQQQQCFVVLLRRIHPRIRCGKKAVVTGACCWKFPPIVVAHTLGCAQDDSRAGCYEPAFQRNACDERCISLQNPRRVRPSFALREGVCNSTLPVVGRLAPPAS